MRMVAEVESDYDSPWAAMNAVATKLGVGTGETVRKWVRQAEIDGGVRPGTTTEESEEVKRLRREVAELKRANEILKAASLSSRPRSTGHTSVGEVHRPARRPLHGGTAVGCRVDLRPARRAGRGDRPVDLLRRPRRGVEGPEQTAGA